ncbi:helix-turn-helix domain-containing protein [Nonomuraea sp. NPDC051941]|uniref:helix-turn-helix domain-containing protein n=1 Tax=Nonomuraea sp. NPDC051941 TaxID=3364373 RepID=UPI0037C9CCB4
MTQQEWPVRLAHTVATEVQKHRRRRGMSAQDLANTCGELGVPFSRSAIANFESGRRPSISLAELLVLARALGVAPVLLVFPLGGQAEAQVPPGETVDTWDAVRWFAGDTVDALPTDDEYPSVVEDYRWHDDLIAQWRRARKDLDELLLTDNPDQKLIAAHNGLLAAIRGNLAAGRKRLRNDGLMPPKLPPGLADLREET